MAHHKIFAVGVCTLVFLSASGHDSVNGQQIASLTSQSTPPNSATPVEQVKAIIQQSIDEYTRFIQSGGRQGDAMNPSRRWATRLLELRDQYRTDNPEAAALASGAAMRALVSSDQFDVAVSFVEALPADDSSWSSVFSILLAYGGYSGDYSRAIRKAEDVIGHTTRVSIRATMQYNIGIARQLSGDLERAKQAYGAALVEEPTGPTATLAKARLKDLTYVVENLSIGSIAPPLTGTTVTGKPIALSDYRGSVVLVDIWATWCPYCIADVPMLKALRSAYDDKDLVIIGVSLDQDAKVLQQMVALKGLDWPQVFDAKGFGGPVPRAFRVFGTPTYFVISRAGRIVAQNVARDKLKAVVATAVERRQGSSTQ